MTGPSIPLLENFAQAFNTPEPALRLLLTILIGYPLGCIYRVLIHNQGIPIKHSWFILIGTALGVFNYGLDFAHCWFTVFVTFVILRIFNANTFAVALSFGFNMFYLLSGYYLTESESYDILWTMPQCVLTLRMIGLTYDLYDSFHVPENKLSNDSRRCVLKSFPSLFETYAFAMFPTAFLVGPQFPMSRYLRFVENKFEANDKYEQPIRSGSIPYALRALILGAVYLGIYTVGSNYVPTNMLLQNEFAEKPLWRRLLLLGAWGRLNLYKYISCWLLAEGGCALHGLTYNGVDKSGQVLWTGCQNVKITIFECCTVFNHYIQSFNINTNQWVAQYVFKRLKFLGNRYISQLAALMFLAVWHGLHIGYYVTFLGEFMVMYFEKDLEAMLKNYPSLQRKLNNVVVRMLMHLYTFVFMGFSLIPFIFFTPDKFMLAYKNVYYCGFIFFAPWAILYKPLVKFCLKNFALREPVDAKSTSSKVLPGKVEHTD